jgi:hypothetical protein
VFRRGHSKLYCTFLETRIYFIYFFDLMQIVTQAQFFLLSIINTKIFDNCANKQKNNRMNNDDNENKTKNHFQKIHYFKKHKLFNHKRIINLKKNKIKPLISKVTKFWGTKEKSQELSIRPCKSVIFKVDLYMKMFGLCTISRLNTIVNEKMRLFNSTYIKAYCAQSSFYFRFDQKFLEIVTFERVLPMGARPRPSLSLF